LLIAAPAESNDTLPMDVTEWEGTAAVEDPLEGVVARRSVDYLLRNTQQQLVALTGQADMKASIVITASSLVLSVTATQWDRDSLQPAVYVLAGGMLGAMFAAILAVVPKFRLKAPKQHQWPTESNALFFGHFTRVEPAVWMHHMRDVLSDDSRLYQAILTDLHQQGDYLVRSKYRYLRAAYVLVGASFGLSAVLLTINNFI
jgi:hypothetical protein